MNDSELADILSVSRRNNEAANITGILIYSDGTFIQVLEGAEVAVKKAFLRIEFDPRHRNIIKLTEGELPERNFTDWHMGFMSVNKAAMAQLQGYINPNDSNFIKSDNSHAAITILKTFVENNTLGV